MKTVLPPAPSVAQRAPTGTILRKCECGGTCDSCREAEKEKPALIQRRSNHAATPVSGGVAAPVSSQIHGAMQTGGSPLPGPTRGLMESRFASRNFSGVRIHTDTRADSLARNLGAEAFTVGSHIFFAANRFNPDSAAGARTLAHELTHVVQQGDSAVDVQTKLEVGSPDTAAEREAEHVADRIVGGGSASAISSVPQGVIQRQCPPNCPPPQSVQTSGSTRRIVLDPSVKLPIFGLKALDAADLTGLVKRYDNAAKSHNLQTTHVGRLTPSTEALWEKWSISRRPDGDPVVTSTDPNYRGSLCSPDHIQELNVGGADDANNLRLLGRQRNQTAGSKLGAFVRQIYDAYNLSYTDNNILEFQAVEAVNVEFDAADPCLLADPKGRLDSSGAFSGALATASGTKALRFKVGGNPVAVGYHPDGAVDPSNRFAVAGLDLKKVKPADKTIEADISPEARATTGKAIKQRRLPLKPGANTAMLLRVNGDTLEFVSAPPPVKLVFRFLSEASLDQRIENGAWIAAGFLTPSLPIFRSLQVQLEIRDGQLKGGVTVPAEKLRQAMPVPGLILDPVSLLIEVGDAEFSATGGFGFRYGTLASGQVSCRFVPATGFQADGNIDLHIPGLDQASGTAQVRDGKFGAHLRLGKDKFKFPAVSSVSIGIDVAEGILTGSGNILLAIPGLRDASLGFTANSQGQYNIAGSATANIPGLKDPRLDLIFAGGKFTGQAHAGFAIPGLESGGMDLRYVDGKLSGSASIDYRKGKLSGRVTAALSPAMKLSGSGQLGYEIAPGLVAIVGLELRENGTAKVSGELRLPDPIILFPQQSFDKKLFGMSLDIPIFGISVGSSSVGVIANLSAALNARAGIGPGQIQKPRIMAAFDPMDEAGAASFQASAQLYVPAFAEIAVTLSGGIGVSLLIVKAIGGIQATGAAGLQGALSIPIELKYTAGKFSVDGAAELTAQPHLRFALDAFVKVVLDLLLTSVEVYKKEWKLAAFEWGSDFQIGLRFPVHYVFGEPFKLSLDQVQFIAPQIDAHKLVRDLLPK